MTEKSAIPRRVVLTAGSVGLASASALALAACAPTSTAGSGEAANNAQPTAGATSSAAATSGSASGSTAGGAEIAKLADIPVGGAKSVTFNGQDLLVSQPAAGSVVCFSSVCPHQGCAVGIASSDFACPCHGSTFTFTTGDVTHGPATKGLTAVAIKVDGDSIVAA
ncbi:Rieske (2Fe-2S) protein [Subtercola endophyticus]|uniref:Rieske (2Fe-2S) protein n=1 Tax=Subtercola endophyticus TaxID=2895559 RepID=UPI001E35F13B|nr:Rieske (2Fe-2S) protein [Subtercola endophyticus]UFS59012.1 Rieske (2Fe-2S) protein [Subtercola endophyticus]